MLIHRRISVRNQLLHPTSPSQFATREPMPFGQNRSLLDTYAVAGFDNRLDRRVHDFSSVHVHFDFIADFGLALVWAVLRHGVIVRQSTRGYWVPEIKSRREI